MPAAHNFDRLAGIYRALEYAAFGRALERARFAHLDRLRDCRSLLVTGEGDGRCLARLVRLAPRAHIDCLDSSAAMLERASARLAGTAAGRVTFRQADALTAPLPAAQYDGVLTLFFLDCFTTPQVEELIRRLGASLRPGALWLWADFAEPPRGWPRWRARLWLAGLYAFFRWQTGLAARQLPPMERLFAGAGWRPLAGQTFQHGLLRSVVWRADPPGLNSSDRPGFA